MAYALRGSDPPVEGSIHAPIFVAASSARLRQSAIREWRTDLVIPPGMFQLWQGFHCMDERFSIIHMESGYIQRGQGGRFSLGGTGSRFLRV